VVDAYFMKKDFIGPVLKMDLQVITKTRTDANMMYLFTGKQNAGRGRKKKYTKKIDFKKIDKRIFKLFNTDMLAQYYVAKVYSVSLKSIVKIIYMLDVKTKNMK